MDKQIILVEVYIDKRDFAHYDEINGKVIVDTEEGKALLTDVGDIIVPALDLVIENKTAIDMFSSIIDGRYKKQAEKMQIYKNKYWYLKMFNSGQLSDPKQKAIETASHHLLYVYGIQVVKVFSHVAMIHSINTLIETLINKDELIAEHYIKTFGSFESDYDRKVTAIACAEGIGLELGKRLIDKYNTIEKLVTCSNEEFTNIKGIGESKAYNLLRFLHT